VLVRVGDVACFIVNTNHGGMRPDEKLCVTDCVTDRILLAVPRATEWQRVENQINAALIVARAYFVSVRWLRRFRLFPLLLTE
jgi:hypothetical protein